MIKICHKSDLDLIQHLPIEVQQAISDDIAVLDNCYGENRNADCDIGGFVVVCDKGETIHIPNFNRDTEIPEFEQKLDEYTKYLYISGAERNIIIYERSDA